MKKSEIVAAFEAFPKASHLVLKLDGDNLYAALRSEKGEVLASTTADSPGGAVRGLIPNPRVLLDVEPAS